MSNLAPTSMPRVGSSNSSTWQSRSSQRPITTFCWLPPDSSPTTWWAPALRIRMAWIWRSAKACSAWPSSTPARDTAPRLPKAMLALIDCVNSRPSPLRSSVISAIPAFTAALGESMVTVCSGWPSAMLPLSARSAP
ncbi:hypothetical protein D3C80_1532510 [compost metagenome]